MKIFFIFRKVVIAHKSFYSVEFSSIFLFCTKIESFCKYSFFNSFSDATYNQYIYISTWVSSATWKLRKNGNHAHDWKILRMTYALKLYARNERIFIRVNLFILLSAGLQSSSAFFMLFSLPHARLIFYALSCNFQMTTLKFICKSSMDNCVISH